MDYFDQIAGYDQEKESLVSLSKIIKNESKLKEIGGHIPHGLLLIGDNGIGKTVLANAFVKASKAHLVKIKDSDAYKVGNDSIDFSNYLYQKFASAAKEKSSIIMIDEADKLFGTSPLFFMNDNFDKGKLLLNVINDYSKADNIFVLMIANTHLQIEESLIRSGRIDRIIYMSLPSQSDREKILLHFAKGKYFNDNVAFDMIAKETYGFSGADLEVIMNEAVISAFSDNRKKIALKDIEDAISNKRFGCLEKQSYLNPESQKIVATHEAGHAVVSLFKFHKTLNSLSILPRGNTQGMTERTVDESGILSLDSKKNMIATCLGGRAAEIVYYGQEFDGSQSDIDKAMSVAKALVTCDGYFGFYGVLNKDDDSPSSNFVSAVTSSKKANYVEKKVTDLMESGLSDAKNIIENNKPLMNSLIEALLQKGVLKEEEIDFIFTNYEKNLRLKQKTLSAISKRESCNREIQD